MVQVVISKVLRVVSTYNHSVQELNIYEGINQNAVYGTLVLVDSINLLANLPIQGTERLMFKLSTPGASEAAIDRRKRRNRSSFLCL